MMTYVKVGLFVVCAGTLYAALGCCGAAAAADDCGAKAGTASVTASGTFTDSANGVSATISGASIFVERESVEGTTSSVVELTASNLSFSSPSGVTSSDFICDIEFTSAPSSGTTTETSSGVSGGVELTYENANGGDTYSAEAGGSGAAGTGTWSLDLSSVNQFCGASDVEVSESEYTVHGSLNASMIGSLADGGTATGTLSLTF